MTFYLTPFIFIFLSILYFYIPFGYLDYYKTLLTISTFLFSIFTGFFISRQGSRYSDIRDRITEFDGIMSSLYRQTRHLGKEAQEKIKKIIEKHYKQIIKNQAWDYNFTHKSTTLTDVHNLLEKTVGEKKLPSLGHAAINRIMAGLLILQQIRKSMIALHKERIPQFQWILLYFLAAVLFLSLSMMPTQGLVYASLLKGAFASSIIFVFVLLKKFDRLDFFEKTIGEESAQDILDIFSGKK